MKQYEELDVIVCNIDERMHGPPIENNKKNFIIKKKKIKILHQMGWDLFAPYYLVKLRDRME